MSGSTAYDAATGAFFSFPRRLTVSDTTAFRQEMLAASAAARAFAQPLPLGFVLPGRPAAGAVLNLVMAIPVTLPLNLVGTAGYAGTTAAAATVFVLRRIAADGAVSALGTLTFTPGVSGVVASATPAVTLFAGEVLQLVAPTTQDAALADIGITFLVV